MLYVLLNLSPVCPALFQKIVNRNTRLAEATVKFVKLVVTSLI